MQDPLPQVSIIIPCLNEEDFIDDCLKSLLNGNYPLSKIELLVIDGNSVDKTAANVRALTETYDNIKLLMNPKKIVPAAMNLGIGSATNEIILWCGAHAKYDANYVINSVKTLLEENCASVGGVINPIAKTNTGNAIALATSSKFGIGNAHYRYAKQKMSVDTVFGGCFYKSSVQKIGGFNEEWIRNQDYEFNYRLRSAIGKIILNPSIQCQYYCRETITQLAKQYFMYGYWRFNTLRKHPNSFTLRQAAPVALIVGLFFSIVLIVSNQNFGWVAPLSYLSAVLLASIHVAAKTKMISLIWRLPAIFTTIHLSWGLGFIKNMLESVYNRVFKAL